MAQHFFSADMLPILRPLPEHTASALGVIKLVDPVLWPASDSSMDLINAFLHVQLHPETVQLVPRQLVRGDLGTCIGHLLLSDSGTYGLAE